MTHDDSHDIDASAHESDDVHDASEPTTDGEGPAGSMERRDYLRAVAAAAALGGLGSAASSSAAAETADTSLDIDERIEEHRTGDLEVVVENPDGSTVSDASVSVSQQEHDFGFGTAVNANTLINSSSEGDNYREYIPELFNKAVMENRHKWDFFENEQALADEATDWVLDQGLEMRGHVCLWGRDDVGAIPSDIQTAIDQGDAETIRERSMAHIEEIITHYGDDLTEWEVVNEAMHAYQMQIGVYGDRIDTEEPWTGEVVPWTSQLLADWYDRAESVIAENGYDLGIAVNDFNQFPYSYTDGRYQREIEHLNASAVQLDTIGLQAHVAARTGEFNTNSSPDGRISAEQVATEMNKWADLGGRLKITEFDTYNGSDWNSDEERAQMLENYLRGAFSHPGCDDFIMWGFWDGRHWENEAPLFYRDWSRKPGYDVWTGLVYDEWWTDEAGTTDAAGSYATDAFLGDHEVTVTTDSGSTIETVSLTDTSGTTVTVTVDGDGTGGDTRPPSVPENLSVTQTTETTVTVSWDGVSDNGSAGLAEYVVAADGTTQTVGAGMTTATVDGLSAGTTYTVSVTAVDAAGNESAAATAEATTASADGGQGDDGDGSDGDTPTEALVVNDYDGDPAWSDNRNDLGNWAGAGSFENGGGSGEGVDGTLELDYDGGGWFVEQINQDVSAYSAIVFVLSGANGGEGEDFTVSVGGASGTFADLADGSVSTSQSELSIDMDAAGIDASSPGELRFNFWSAGSGSSTLELAEVRLE